MSVLQIKVSAAFVKKSESWIWTSDLRYSDWSNVHRKEKGAVNVDSWAVANVSHVIFCPTCLPCPCGPFLYFSSLNEGTGALDVHLKQPFYENRPFTTSTRCNLKPGLIIDSVCLWRAKWQDASISNQWMFWGSGKLFCLVDWIILGRPYSVYSPFLCVSQTSTYAWNKP